MLSRQNLYTVPGGDTMQINKTAEYLRRLGVEVNIGLLGESYDYSDYNLVHLFNIIVPEQIEGLVRKLSIPYVVSTIFVDYGEYENRSRRGLLGTITRHLPPSFIEYGKAVIKALINRRLPNLRFLFSGFDSSVARIASGAAILLPNSQSEMRRLSERFGVSSIYHVVPNGVDVKLFQPIEGIMRDDSLVLCIARIEGLKNQLNLIRAIKGTGLKLKIVGNTAPNHQAYYAACVEEGDGEVEFIPHVDQRELVKLLCQAKVHVLPSWFETTGLVSLEAALMGCNIVVSDRGDVREYLGDYAHYCEPDSVASIRAAVIAATRAESRDELSRRIREHYTWQRAAEETLWAYRQVLHVTD